MKTNVFIYFLIIIFIAGCSKNVTDNPVSPNDNSSGKGKSLSKVSNIKEIKADQVSPEILKSLELKRKEFGIKFDPNLPHFKSERVDLSKHPEIVLLTLSEIEKLSPRKGKYFSGHNLILNDPIIFDYYSWCYPYPSPTKPWLELLGAAQSTNYQMDYMDIFSLHYLNWEFQDGWEAWGWNISSLSTPQCAHTNTPNYPWDCYWEAFGYHYFERYSGLPECEYYDTSYAYDGLL